MNEIETLIPQRPPMVMVDALLYCDVQHTETKYRVTPEGLFVEEGRELSVEEEKRYSVEEEKRYSEEEEKKGSVDKGRELSEEEEKRGSVEEEKRYSVEEEGRGSEEKRRLSAAGLLENMAQTTAARMGYLALYGPEATGVVRKGVIGAIREFSVYALPQCGQTLKTSIDLVEELGDMILVEANVKCGELLCASCTMIVSLI